MINNCIYLFIGSFIFTTNDLSTKEDISYLSYQYKREGDRMTNFFASYHPWIELR